MSPVFLSLDEVLAMHQSGLRKHGGEGGMRDIGQLRQALAWPEARFGEAWLHSTIHEMAAAYLYHIVQIRPFVDGNKRTGLLAALVFLGLNGLRLEGTDGLLETVLGAAAGTVSKAEVAVYFQRRVKPIKA